MAPARAAKSAPRCSLWVRLLLLAILTCAAAPAAHVHADGTADEADLHFRLGNEAYRVGNFLGALEHYLASNRLVPNHNVVFNIARTYQRLEMYPEAYRYYASALAAEEDTEARERIAAAMTDIAPSILAHLGISAPEPIQTEMDGTSFIGDISFDGLRARMSGDTLHAQWRAWDKTGTARIAVAFANDFKTGGADTYETLLEAPLADEKADLILNAAQLDKFKQNRFLKISVQAPFNRGNYWITVPPPAEK